MTELRLWSPVWPRRSTNVFVLVVTVVGAALGLRYAGHRCVLLPTSFVHIAFTNLALCLVIAAGILSRGIITLLVGIPVFLLTGATIGSAFAMLGLRAILLIAPHGLLEVYGWLLATDIGFGNVRTKPGQWLEPESRARLIRSVCWMTATILTAAAVETLWTNWYRVNVGC